MLLQLSYGEIIANYLLRYSIQLKIHRKSKVENSLLHVGSSPTEMNLDVWPEDISILNKAALNLVRLLR